MTIQQQNGSYNVDGFVVTKSQGRLICACGANRCSHVAQLSTYLNNTSKFTTTGQPAVVETESLRPGTAIAPQSTQLSNLPDPFSRITLQKEKASKHKSVASIYIDFASQPFTEQQTAILTKAVNVEDLEILPSGEIYASQVFYRRRLNEAFRPGGWGLRRWGKMIKQDKFICRDYALFIAGRLIAVAMGEAKYQPGKSRKSYASALEACKSNALMRCCKDIGVASECWDRKFTNQFKKEYCVAVWRDGYKDPESGKNRPCWRLRSDSPFYDEIGMVNQKDPSQSENSKTEHPSQSQSHRSDSYSSAKILPAQIQAITSLCNSIGENPDAWMRKTFAVSLQDATAEIAKKAIPMLNILRSNCQGK